MQRFCFVASQLSRHSTRIRQGFVPVRPSPAGPVAIAVAGAVSGTVSVAAVHRTLVQTHHCRRATTAPVIRTQLLSRKLGSMPKPVTRLQRATLSSALVQPQYRTFSSSIRTSACGCASSTTSSSSSSSASAASRDWPALKQKADAGDADAQFKYGAALFRRDADPDASFDADQRAHALDGTEDKDLGTGAIPSYVLQSMYYFRKASDAGNAGAQYVLAAIYLDGIVTVSRPQAAVELLIKSAEQNYVLAQVRLAHCYETGHGVAVDRKAAFKWYDRAAQLGDANGLCNAGYALEHGIGTMRDEDTAFEYYQRASAKGHEQADVNIALCLLHGVGTDPDAKTAVDILQRLVDAETNNSIVYTTMAMCHLLGEIVPVDNAKAISMLRHASADLDDPVAQHNLALLLQEGEVVGQNFIEAASLLEQSAGHGYADAQFELARAHMSGMGVDRNDDVARVLLRHAASAHHEGAIEMLQQLEHQDDSSSSESIPRPGEIVFPDVETWKGPTANGEK
jgi:TPR repeat protein